MVPKLGDDFPLIGKRVDVLWDNPEHGLMRTVGVFCDENEDAYFLTRDILPGTGQDDDGEPLLFVQIGELTEIPKPVHAFAVLEPVKGYVQREFV